LFEYFENFGVRASWAKFCALTGKFSALHAKEGAVFPKTALTLFSKSVSKIVFEIVSKIILKLVSKLINISKHLIVLGIVSSILASGFSGLYSASTIGAGYAAKALPEPSPFLRQQQRELPYTGACLASALGRSFFSFLPLLAETWARPPRAGREPRCLALLRQGTPAFSVPWTQAYLASSPYPLRRAGLHLVTGEPCHCVRHHLPEEPQKMEDVACNLALWDASATFCCPPLEGPPAAPWASI
jgi:hypothetical protein